ILMDIQLPEVSGLEVTKWLKDDPDLKAIPVVAITAFAMKGDEERIREGGCEAYLSKPISVGKFIETIRHFLGSGCKVHCRVDDDVARQNCPNVHRVNNRMTLFESARLFVSALSAEAAIPCGELRSPHLLGPWGSAGPGAVRAASSCRCFRPATCFLEWSLLGPDDGPTFFAELDQCDDAGLHALGILDKGWFLAFLAGHCLKRVLAGHERDIRHALLKRFQPRLHRGGIIAQHV